MARDHGRVYLSIWDNPEFTALPHVQQWTYLTLITSRYLTYCGAHPLVPAVIARQAGDLTERRVTAALRGLNEARFVTLAQETSELAVRTYVYHDGILKQPNMVRAMTKALGLVVSDRLRESITREIGRAVERTFPDGIPGGVAKALREGFPEGFPEGFVEGSGEATSHSLSPYPLPLRSHREPHHSSSLPARAGR